MADAPSEGTPDEPEEVLLPTGHTASEALEDSAGVRLRTAPRMLGGSAADDAPIALLVALLPDKVDNLFSKGYQTSSQEYPK